MTWQPKETPVAPTPGFQLTTREPLLPAAGSWQVDPARSHASFVATVAGRPVRGRVPLTGQVLVTDPAENSRACLAAAVSAVSTGSATLDRLLAGPSFLDAGRFPAVTFRSERLACVATGWRTVGLLQVKNVDHELACSLALTDDEARPGEPPRISVTCTWVLDSRWIASQWLPGLGRHIEMTCSFSLQRQT
jgi:polyisoprenoid-binding protein YceI